jgi:small multidrug resistance pump
MKSPAGEQVESRPPVSRILIAAGTYNLLWGLFVILTPTTLFRWAGMEPQPNYPELWQCMGMVIGVYGIGYLIAAFDPLRHWPIVLVGLLGKVFGPIGFVWTAADGRLPWSFGAVILTNDLIWWIPFATLLWRAWKHHRKEAACPTAQLAQNPPGRASAA